VEKESMGLGSEKGEVGEFRELASEEWKQSVLEL